MYNVASKIAVSIGWMRVSGRNLSFSFHGSLVNEQYTMRGSGRLWIIYHCDAYLFWAFTFTSHNSMLQLADGQHHMFQIVARTTCAAPWYRFSALLPAHAMSCPLIHGCCLGTVVLRMPSSPFEPELHVALHLGNSCFCEISNPPYHWGALWWRSLLFPPSRCASWYGQVGCSGTFDCRLPPLSLPPGMAGSAV